jgi:hypothetical protein
VKAVAELIDGLRAKHAIGRPAAEHEIRERWPEIVGALNASHSHPVRIDEAGRLLVHVGHSVVRDELFFNRAEIVERVRRIPGGGAVKRLHLSQG